MKVVAGTSHVALAESIARYLKVSLASVDIGRFADSEIYIKVQENVTGEDVYIVQSLAPFVHEYLIELCGLSYALKKKGAKKIIAVIPYYAYARQDKENQDFVFLVANLLKASGVDNILTLDFHNPGIKRFLPLSVDVSTVIPIFANDIQNRFENKSIAIVSPDVGGIDRARCLSEKLNADLVALSKVRESIGEDVCILKIETDVKGKNCVIIDDIVDSGATLFRAAEALKKAGAREVHAYVTHAVLSNGVDKLKQSKIDSLTTTNSIKQSDKINSFNILSIAETLANRIMEKSE
jgi:ribose-phosphate pyrophosphokinase